MKIHEDDCPALCEAEIVYSTCTYSDHHETHACACHAAEKLRELVEAAEASDKMHGNQCSCHDRLRAALQPFREVKP